MWIPLLKEENEVACSGERKTTLQLEEALSKSISKQVVFVFLRL